MRKKTVTRWTLEGRRVPANTPGAIAVKEVIGWVQKIDGREVLLGKLKETAKTALAERLQAHQLRKHGVTPAIVNHRAKLSEVFGRYRDYQVAKGLTENYIQTTETRLTRVTEFNGWTRIDQIDGAGVEAFLADAAKKDRKHSSTRFGRVTQNLHRATWRALGRWMERTNQVMTNPMRALEIHRSDTDSRLKRRAYTAEEAGALLQHVPHLGRRSLMEGPHRAALYAVALASGFRLAECAQLRPESLVWLDGLPFLALPPEATKNRREAFQPIPASLVEVLRPVMDATAPGGFLFPLQRKTAKTEMARSVRKDLAEVRKRLSDPAPGFLETHPGGQLDFHSFRTTYASVLAIGVSSATLGKLARHSNVQTTQKHYVAIGQKLLHGAVESAIGGQVWFSPGSPEQRKTVKSGEIELAKLKAAVLAFKEAANPEEISDFARFLWETFGADLARGQGVEGTR